MYYTNQNFSIAPEKNSVRLFCKSPSSPLITADLSEENVFVLNVADPGEYYCQFVSADNRIVAEKTIFVKQDLASAPEDYDPRSLAVRTLEALEAKIAGRALTIQQSSITVGDRSIQYMNSLDELMKWRNHFAELVAREKGNAAPKAQILILKRG